MFKRIIMGLVIICMMISIAAARIEPSFVQIDRYGIEPSTYLAIAVGIGALIQHLGRYSIKKRTNPDIKYDMGYAVTTLMSITAMVQLQASIPVVDLSFTSVLFAFATGLGINEATSKASKVVK